MRRIVLCFSLIFSVALYAQKKEIALTPPMGWNSWNYFACEGLNETVVRDMADAMVASGMKDAGYEYIVLDDCWQIARDENGKIIADPEKFPSGIKALADYVHSKGLKFGLYSDAGRKTCEERPGGYQYEEIDAKTYEEWGVDYLKYDWCHSKFLKPQKTYPRMGKALAELDRPIVYSVCNWGRKKPWKWAGEFAHLWRTTGDIKPCFDCKTFVFFHSVCEIVDAQAGLQKYARPGAWNDPDMLQVGNGDMTLGENRAHFSMWCMMAAPLMAGNDLASMKPEILSILTNKVAIAINQDKKGVQGYKIKDYGAEEIWIKPLEDGGIAICFLNRGSDTWMVNEYFQHLGIKEVQPFTNAWENGQVKVTEDRINVEVLPHDVVLLKF